jgi:hypothetical protein
LGVMKLVVVVAAVMGFVTVAVSTIGVSVW